MDPVTTTAVAGIGQSVVNSGGGIISTAMANKHNERMYDKALQDSINAEERANAEWWKRYEAEQSYNDAWAERLRKQGLNPLFQISKGQAGAMAASNPSQPNQAATPQAPRMNAFPLSINALESMMAAASIRKTNAEAEQIEEQTNKTFQEGKAQFLENCITEFMYGEAPNIQQETELFEVRYGASVDEEGNITFENLGNISRFKDNSIRLNVNLYKYSSEKYGDFVIYEGSYNVRKAREELLSVVGNNYQIAEDLAQSWSGLYTSLLNALSSGKQADAALITAMAKDLEANYKFGDEFNVKWWIETALKLIHEGANVAESIAHLKGEILKAKPKTTTRERHTYKSATGTDTYETVTTN